jgi:hypothetical protein
LKNSLCRVKEQGFLYRFYDVSDGERACYSVAGGFLWLLLLRVSFNGLLVARSRSPFTVLKNGNCRCVLILISGGGGNSVSLIRLNNGSLVLKRHGLIHIVSNGFFVTGNVGNLIFLTRELSRNTGYTYT